MARRRQQHTRRTRSRSHKSGLIFKQERGFELYIAGRKNAENSKWLVERDIRFVVTVAVEAWRAPDETVPVVETIFFKVEDMPGATGATVMLGNADEIIRAISRCSRRAMLLSTVNGVKIDLVRRSNYI